MIFDRIRNLFPDIPAAAWERAKPLVVKAAIALFALVVVASFIGSYLAARVG